MDQLHERQTRNESFQAAEVEVPRKLFASMLERVKRFGVPPPVVQRG